MHRQRVDRGFTATSSLMTLQYYIAVLLNAQPCHLKVQLAGLAPVPGTGKEKEKYVHLFSDQITDTI